MYVYSIGNTMHNDYNVLYLCIQIILNFSCDCTISEIQGVKKIHKIVLIPKSIKQLRAKEWEHRQKLSKVKFRLNLEYRNATKEMCTVMITARFTRIYSIEYKALCKAQSSYPVFSAQSRWRKLPRVN